jgi:hypothetical protein
VGGRFSTLAARWRTQVTWGTEIAPEVADDPELAARLDDLLHRTSHLARALTGAEQAAFKVDLDGDGHAPASSSTSASATSAGATTA